MSLVEKIRERFAKTDLSKYADFKSVLQYNILEGGAVAVVFGNWIIFFGSFFFILY